MLSLWIFFIQSHLVAWWSSIIWEDITFPSQEPDQWAGHPEEKYSQLSYPLPHTRHDLQQWK